MVWEKWGEKFGGNNRVCSKIIMEILLKRKPQVESVARVVSNLVLPEDKKQPLSVALDLTNACQANCWFCSHKDDLNDGSEPEEARLMETLGIIRQGCSILYLMGGEPTRSPHLKRVLEKSENLGFDIVAVNTNAIDYSEAILEHANMLVVSLPSLDPAKIAQTMGIDEMSAQRIIHNIRKYAENRDSSQTQMVVNVVVTGQNIRDVYEIANFCDELGILLNVAPAIMPNGRPDKRLVGNPEYQQLIDDLIADPRLMACSISYLEVIRDFKDFNCTPHASVRVTKDGYLVVPCDGVQKPQLVDLNEVGSLKKALAIGREAFGAFVPAEECADRCHKTCYVEASFLDSPATVIDLIKGWFRRRKFIEEPDDNGQVEDTVVAEVTAFIRPFFEDLHRYDSVERGLWERQHDIFSERLVGLNDCELLFLESFMAELVEFYELRFDELFTNLQKVAAITGDLVNQFVTRVFPRIFKFLENVSGQQIVSDFTGSRKLYRLDDYLKRIRKEMLRRDEMIRGSMNVG